jgi:hypothetical protein
MSAKQSRIAAGRSQEWIAVMSGTSVPSVRLYEVDPNEVKNPRKRESLDRTYAGLRTDSQTEAWR